MSNEQSNSNSSVTYVTVLLVAIILCINVFFLYKYFLISNEIEDIQNRFLKTEETTTPAAEIVK